MIDAIAETLFTGATVDPMPVSCILGIVFLGTNTSRIIVKQKGIVHTANTKRKKNKILSMLLLSIFHDKGNLQSTATSHIQFITVHQFLFRQTDQLCSIQIVSSFNGNNGTKRPAGSAHVLILDRNDGSTLDRIDFGGQIFEFASHFGLGLWNSVHDNSRTVLSQLVEVLVFFNGQIRKLVVSKSVGRSWFLLIVSLNKDCSSWNKTLDQDYNTDNAFFFFTATILLTTWRLEIM